MLACYDLNLVDLPRRRRALEASNFKLQTSSMGFPIMIHCTRLQLVSLIMDVWLLSLSIHGPSSGYVSLP